MNLQDTIIENEEIFIEDSSIFNAIGPGVVLKECTIHCNVPSKSLGIRGELERCRFVAKRKLTGFSWLNAKLSNCTFKGVFKENFFGTANGSSGYCKACDFSDADLDDCYFFGESCESHKFPKWPNFVVLHPHKHFAEMKNQPKDKQLEIAINALGLLDKEVNAITYNSKTLAKRRGISPSDIQKFYSQFTFVQL